MEEVSKFAEYFMYETADLKTILFDVSASVRGIGGVKTILKPQDLPSFKRDKNLKDEMQAKLLENETDADKKTRHKEFFEQLKNSFNNK